MTRRVLDHNVVLDLWHGRSPSKIAVRNEATARAAAGAWLKEHPGDGLVTPVVLEFVGGTRDREEQRLGDLFLGEFRVFDEGRVLPEDWRLAGQFARRIRGKGAARGVIDCLILALCVRLNAEVVSHDGGVKRH